MNKRTDRRIALGGVAATAIVLPVLLVGLAHGGNHKSPHPGPNAGAVATPGNGPDDQLQPSTDQPTPDPTQTSPDATNPGGDQPTTGGQDPDTNPNLQHQQPHLPPGSKPAKNGSRTYARADDGAMVTAVKQISKYQLDVTVATPALATSVNVRLLVPRTWSLDAGRTWPVIYAYHGGNNNYRSWTVDSNLPQVAANTDVLIVMPEGGWDGSYTNWWNGGQGGTPEWETFHTQEVIQLMERNFHAGASRAAIGLSSGGQGSITYAERHPGLFKFAASYSGALNITGLGMPTALMALNSNAGTDPENIWGNPLIDRANWEAHDATVNVDKLRGIGVFVSAGNGQPGPYDNGHQAPWDAARLGEDLAGRMTQNFVNAAQQQGVPITADLYGPGTHRWVYWDRELIKSWPAITAAIGAQHY